MAKTDPALRTTRADALMRRRAGHKLHAATLPGSSQIASSRIAAGEAIGWPG